MTSVCFSLCSPFAHSIHPQPWIYIIIINLHYNLGICVSFHV